MTGSKKYKLLGIKDQKIALKLLCMGLKTGEVLEVQRTNISGSTIYITIDQRAYGIGRSLFEQMNLEPLS